MSDKTGYSTLQIALHWLIAGLIFGAWFTHEGMDKALEARIQNGAAAPTIHVILGLSVLALVILRIVLRATRGVPGPVPGSSPGMVMAANWGHRILYLLMFATPILGMITWSRGLESVGEVHEVAGMALIVIAVGHGLVALWHQFVQKDGVLVRMVKPKG